MRNDSDIYNLIRDCGALGHELLELAIARQRAAAQQTSQSTPDKSANITINVQGGHHNVMHTGPEQHNYHAADTPQYCSICGNRMRNAENIANGYHSKCNARVIENRQREDESAEFGRAMQYISAQHREEIEPTPEQQARWYQPLAPGQQYQAPALIVINEPRQSYRDEIAAKYAGDYEQLQSNRAAYNAAEFERVNRSLSDWRVRHPLLRVVQPLPPEMHTCLPDPVLTDREARQQAEWNLLYGGHNER